MCALDYTFRRTSLNDAVTKICCSTSATADAATKLVLETQLAAHITSTYSDSCTQKALLYDMYELFDFSDDSPSASKRGLFHWINRVATKPFHTSERVGEAIGRALGNVDVCVQPTVSGQQDAANEAEEKVRLRLQALRAEARPVSVGETRASRTDGSGGLMRGNVVDLVGRFRRCSWLLWDYGRGR